MDKGEDSTFMKRTVSSPRGCSDCNIYVQNQISSNNGYEWTNGYKWMKGQKTAVVRDFSTPSFDRSSKLKINKGAHDLLILQIY